MNVSEDGSDVVCTDWASGQAAAGIGSYTVGTLGPNTARIVLVTAVATSSLADLVAGQEYFTFNVTINNQKTVGTGSCSGCTTPACVALNSIQVMQLGGGNVTLTTPAYGNDSHYVAWQGGLGVPVLPGGACATADTAGFAVLTSVVGRGSVTRSRYKPQYPPGSPLTLAAVPLPGDRFVAWSGDTTTTEDTLNIVVNRALSYVATFEKDPAAAPHLLAITDYPGDEGSFVLAHWDPSPLDVPGLPFINYYYIQRRAMTPPDAPWTSVALYPAVMAPSYALGATTPADSTAADPAVYLYRIVANAPDTLEWVSNEVPGYSVDNLPPAAPSSVTGSFASGTATMFWPAVSAADLGHYAIYRGLEDVPPTDPAHLVGTTTLTGFTDSPGYFTHYRVAAVDIHGNQGEATAFVPSNTTGVDGRQPPGSLTVGDPVPSPMARRMSLTLGLPRAMNVTADVLDPQGRLTRRIADGERPAGWAELTWDARDANGRPAAAGMYFVRIRTPEGERLKRLVLVP